jgi:hypothetical protein
MSLACTQKEAAPWKAATVAATERATCLEESFVLRKQERETAKAQAKALKLTSTTSKKTSATMIEKLEAECDALKRESDAARRTCETSTADVKSWHKSMKRVLEGDGRNMWNLGEEGWEAYCEEEMGEESWVGHEEEEEEEVVVVATHHGIERESGTKSLAELHADGEKEEDRINLHERKQVNPLSTTLRRCYQCHFRLRAMRLRVARLSNLFW